MLFKDRTAAGQRLAEELAVYANRSDVIVLALPRGGVPVAFEVAKFLNAPLDVFLVRKLGVPGQEELAMGAIASGGVRVLNEDIVSALDLSEAVLDEVAAAEQQELERREQAYRDHLPPPNVRDRLVILVDDGVATGATMRAAITALRQLHPAKIIVAVPVASPDICADLAQQADTTVCAAMPSPFRSVGYWYENFGQTTDAEVCHLLKRSQTLLSEARSPVTGEV